MRADWINSTTVQIKAERRDRLQELQVDLSAEARRPIPLREVLDLVLDAGLRALGNDNGANGTDSSV